MVLLGTFLPPMQEKGRSAPLELYVRETCFARETCGVRPFVFEFYSEVDRCKSRDLPSAG
jgi:hypothetical protein